MNYWNTDELLPLAGILLHIAFVLWHRQRLGNAYRLLSIVFSLLSIVIYYGFEHHFDAGGRSLGWWFYWLVLVLALLVLDGVVLLYRSYCRLET